MYLNKNFFKIFFAVLFLGICVLYSVLLNFKFNSILLYIIISIVLFLLGALIAYLNKSSSKNLILFLFIALLCRLTFIYHSPVLSNDIYRYLWEGQIQTQGYNPYAQTPSSKKLKHLRNKTWEKVEHKKIPTIYPPLAQFTFLVSAYISKITGNQLFILKFIFFIFEMGILLLLYILIKSNFKVKYPLIYAFHPIPILEICLNGHVDVVMVFFLVLAFYFKFNKNSELGILCIFLGALSKIIVIILLPFFIEKKRINYLYLFAGVLVFFVAYLPYFSQNMFTGLKTFTRIWSFNAPFYSVLKYFSNSTIARFIELILFSIFYFFFIIKYKQKTFTLKSLVLFTAFFIFSPLVHPWYLLLVLALLVFNFIPSVYLLTGSVFFSYEIYSRWKNFGIWKEKYVILFLIWLPFFIYLIYDIYKYYKKETSGIYEIN